jgi:hypothetical protein
MSGPRALTRYDTSLNAPRSSSKNLFLTQFSGLTAFDIAAPTAQEIADQLPKRVNEYRLFLEYGDDETLWTGYRSAESKSDYMLHADSMAEALAMLWLKLHEATS